MRIMRAVAVCAALAIVPSAGHAQFAPQGMTADPNNPSSVTATFISDNKTLKRVDHYYYDCLKKKWVWVSREWYRAPVGLESGEWTLIPPGPGTAGVPGTKVPLASSPEVKQVPAGPPSGAETSPGDPDRAFNPMTGQNFAKEPDGSWIDVKTGKIAVAPKLCPCPEPSTTPQPPPPKTPKGAQNTICPEKRRTAMLQPLNSFDKRFLDLHNGERALVGAPPLQWNPTLATDAVTWAQQLARMGHLVHAPRERRGIERENLQQGLIGWGPDRLMQNWTAEKRLFHGGIYPNVCSTGDWSQCSHYSQIIWPTTTDLGCGMATGSGFEWLVCRYSPGGNRDGKPVGGPVQIASRPCDDTRNEGAWNAAHDKLSHKLINH